MNPPSFQKRYPGVKPFDISERDLFFGRDRDIEYLLDLIWLEKLVILFGKSGFGKSSLINAGILPEIQKNAVPIVVRLGSFIVGQPRMPLDNLRLKIDELLTNNPDSAFLESLNLPTTLWQQIKRKQSPQHRRFVFFFDQFEEFFTYPIAEQQTFKEQVAELLYTEVPQSVRNMNDTLSDSQQAFIADSFDVRVLFAIRADRMSLLDSMKDKLPAILQNRYELKGLSEVQAREAIEEPAQREGKFASPPFSYSNEALRIMTQKLADTQDARTVGIEAFQLQILCEYLEDKIIKNVIPSNFIEPQHFAFKINDVFEGYYQRLIGRLDTKDQQSARLLIEETMILEDENSGEVRRLSVDEGIMKNEKGITQALLDKLENTFLLRRESTSTGGFNYEVTHDTMIVPILKSKAQRKAQERAEQDLIEARLRRNRLFAVLTLSALMLAIVLAISAYIYQQNIRLEDALIKADQEKIKVQKAYRDVLEAQKAKELADFKIILQNVRLILKGSNCPPKDMIQQIDYMRKKYPKDIHLQSQIKEIDDALISCK